jgi:uncharacterized protein YbjT (DUF2867 family)
LTFADAVAAIAQAAGREIRFVPVPLERNLSSLAEYDVPADVASLVTYLLSEVLDGRNEEPRRRRAARTRPAAARLRRLRA